MNTDPTLLAIVAVLFVGGGLLLGLALGRGSRRLAKRVEELEAELSRSQTELSGYRQQVGQHFNATGELLRAMTVQYRAVYDHLADGARTLCPDQATSLSAGQQEALLTPGPAAPIVAAAEAREEAPDELDLDELETDDPSDPLRSEPRH